MTGIRLAVVTLAYNNVEEVRKTLASVALQSVQPDSFLVVDSSSSGVNREVENLARRASAKYTWIEPDGVYPAMNHALSLLPDQNYVWFINSSDWLAGPNSISAVLSAISPGDSWLIGGLERLGDRRNPYHPTPSTGEAFVNALAAGRVGFPHPSAVIAKSIIDSVGGFDASLKIAADYKQALAVARLVGAPRVTERVLSVHVPTGLTSRHKLKHAIEKLRARFSTVPSHGLGKEIATQLATLGRIIKPSNSSQAMNQSRQGENRFGQEIDSWPGES